MADVLTTEPSSKGEMDTRERYGPRDKYDVTTAATPTSVQSAGGSRNWTGGERVGMVVAMFAFLVLAFIAARCATRALRRRQRRRAEQEVQAAREARDLDLDDSELAAGGGERGTRLAEVQRLLRSKLPQRSGTDNRKRTRVRCQGQLLDSDAVFQNDPDDSEVSGAVETPDSQRQPGGLYAHQPSVSGSYDVTVESMDRAGAEISPEDSASQRRSFVGGEECEGPGPGLRGEGAALIYTGGLPGPRSERESREAGLPFMDGGEVQAGPPTAHGDKDEQEASHDSKDDGRLSINGGEFKAV